MNVNGLLLLSVCGILCAQSPLGAADELLKTRLLSEGMEAWKKVSSTTLNVEYREDAVIGRPGATPFAVAEGVKVSGESAAKDSLTVTRSTEQQIKGPKTTRAYGRNGSYGFAVASTDGTWSISKMYRADSNEVLGSAARYQLSGISIYGKSLPELFGNSSFTIRDVTAENNLAAVEFICNLELAPQMKLVGGRLSFDPRNSWQIARSRLNTDVQGSASTEESLIEYQSVSIGGTKYSLPKRTQVDSQHQGRPRRAVWTYTTVKECKRPQADFMLTAFGLPEPDGVTVPAGSTGSARNRNGQSWLIWLNVAVFSMIILLIAAYQWRRRQET